MGACLLPGVPLPLPLSSGRSFPRGGVKRVKAYYPFFVLSVLWCGDNTQTPVPPSLPPTCIEEL
jgi:hypothetical protein